MAAMTSGRALGHQMIAVITAATAMAAAAFLSGCASGGPQVSALMSELGCPFVKAENAPGPHLVQGAGCSLADGTSVDIVTFGSTADETAWIAQWCHHLIPSAGCVEGNLWVATLNSLPALARADRQRIRSAIGGRLIGKAA
jgi:hypothetical protein